MLVKKSNLLTHVLTECEGRTGKYLTRGYGLGTSGVRVQSRTKYFPV